MSDSLDDEFPWKVTIVLIEGSEFDDIEIIADKTDDLRDWLNHNVGVGGWRLGGRRVSRASQTIEIDIKLQDQKKSVLLKMFH